MVKNRKAQRRPKTRVRIRRDRQTAEALGKAQEQLGAGRLQGCVQICRSILARTPEEPEALFLLALAAAHSGHREPAIEYLHQATALDPSQAHYFDALGVIQLQLKSFADAEVALAQAIRLDPKLVSAHNNLGCVYREKGDLGAAARCFENTLQLCPSDMDVRNNLGVVLLSLGQPAKAISCFEKVLSKNPAQAETLRNLGVAKLKVGMLEEAEISLSKSLELAPDSAKSHNYIGYLYRLRHDYRKAKEHIDKAVQLNPGEDSLNNLGLLLKDQGKTRQAFEIFERLCSSSHPTKPEYISNLLFLMNYLPGLGPEELFAQHARWGAELSSSVEKLPVAPQGQRPPGVVLRVGYVSSDFREHSVRYFIEPVLLNHDPRRVEVYCYSNVQKPDKVTDRLRRLVPHWRDISPLSHRAAAERIRADGIHVLVDLSGHTGKNRLPIFAARPAPIQATYLGYPNTTGLPEMDYRITDEIADPPGTADACHGEALVRLPSCFLCYQPSAVAPTVAAAPVERGHGVTFGSFNNLPKVNDELISLWAQILNRVPGSRLLIKSSQLGDQGVRDDFESRFVAAGVEPGRVEFLQRVESAQGHLGLYHEIDIALDTYPYNGTTTTFEALWMGVPVLTLSGELHASRVSASILSNLGRGELVAETAQGYCDKAVELANDVERIRDYREHLRQDLEQSGLLDGKRMASALETIYQGWEGGQDPFL